MGNKIALTAKSKQQAKISVGNNVLRKSKLISDFQDQ